MSADPAVLDVLAILDEAAAQLVEPDWEWSAIGDNNLLAWEVAARVARITDCSKGYCYPAVCESLRRRWQERFQPKEEQ